MRLEEVPAKQVRDVYKLLLDDSYAIRHAAAELVADMLEESGQRHLGQVYSEPSALIPKNHKHEHSMLTVKGIQARYVHKILHILTFTAQQAAAVCS